MQQVLGLALILCAASITSFRPLPCQVSSEAVKIAASIRSSGKPIGALSVLTQRMGPRPRANLDAIADSLASIVIDDPNATRTNSQYRFSAEMTLIHAGMSSKGTAYVGTAERLFRIAQNATDVGDRSAAISGLAEMPNRTQALGMLRQIAISHNPVAYAAVQALDGDEISANGGLTLLRELHEKALITDVTARRALLFIAKKNGWTIP